jgi:PKD repeat protein
VCTRINKKCSETTDIPCNDNEFLDDRAYIDFTENSEEIAENLDKISAGGGKPARCEPWGDIIKFVLGSDTFSWRPEATWVIINIMDEDDDSAKYMEAAQLAADNNVWLFGIIGYAGGLYGSTKAEQQFDEMLTIAKGKRYSYTDTSEIPNRIMDALSTVLASDSFVLSLEEGPDWDNIAGNLEISNVAREGGTTTITLTLDIPSTSANPVEYVKYRVYVKDNPAIFDDGWIEVTLNTPPQADFVAIPKTGVTPLWVDFDATLSTDAENNIVKYHWDFGDGNTSETSSPKTFHVYRDEGPFFVTLTVEDAAGETDTITKQIYPYSTVALLTVYASDVKIGGMTRVGAKCSKDVNVELRLYKLSSSGMTKIFPPLQTFTITCNVQEVEFGPLYEQGIYMVEAVLLIPPQLCELSCDKASTFLVFSPSPKMLVSEVSLITFLILFAVVLTFINAFRLRR